ncbi:hypothetical protein quinque_008864 [Culex quinquefasciatus]
MKGRGNVVPVDSVFDSLRKEHLIVLVGDPKRLGPVIQCDFLGKTNHGISLLESLELTGFYDQLVDVVNRNTTSH